MQNKIDYKKALIGAGLSRRKAEEIAPHLKRRIQEQIEKIKTKDILEIDNTYEEK